MCTTTVKSIIGVCVSLFLVTCVYVNRTARNPHYGKAFQKLALECQNDCDLNKRFRYFQKAVYYDPNLSDVYYQLGIIYGKQGNYEREIESYKKVTTLDHANADAYFKIGFYYFQRGELDYALRYFLQSKRYKPGSHDTFYYIARTYEKKQMYRDSVIYYVGLFAGGSPFAAEACGRIWRISKILDQYEMALDEVNRMRRSNKEQEKLWEQIDRYLRTDDVSEFICKSDGGMVGEW